MPAAFLSILIVGTAAQSAIAADTVIYKTAKEPAVQATVTG